jgi:uncharacterized protein
VLTEYYYTLLKTIKIWILHTLAISFGLLVCCYLYGTRIEPNWIEIVSIDLTIPRLTVLTRKLIQARLLIIHRR